MTNLDFRHFRQQVFRLYTEGRHADALALVERESGRFPDRWGDILYWRGCLTALLAIVVEPSGFSRMRWIGAIGGRSSHCAATRI